VINWPNHFFERTVLPGATLYFEAYPQDALEIHTGAILGAILSDKILCDRLQGSPG
jgi:hypothetical protein